MFSTCTESLARLVAHLVNITRVTPLLVPRLRDIADFLPSLDDDLAGRITVT